METQLKCLLRSETLPTKNELLDFFSYLTPSELEELDQLLLSVPDRWLPMPGPQTKAYYSEADELFYGGAAGGGKTDLALGLAATAHRRSCIYRMEYPQLDAIVERSQELYSGSGSRFNNNKYQWRLEHGARLIDFRAMQHLNVLKKHQGRPHDLKAYDEITHFAKSQFTFSKAWTRSIIPHQRCRVVAMGNPPTDSDGKWVEEYWAPWLSDQHPNPAADGEIRYFITCDSRDYEVEGKGTFKFKGNYYESKSRTFIASNLNDNLYLVDTDYRATLDALPEPLRSQLLFGSFKAGMADDVKQVIPTAWVKLAQERWKQRERPRIPITAVGLDVARGGNDRTVFAPRYDNYLEHPIVFPGSATPKGNVVAELALTIAPPGTNIRADVIGVGSSPVDFLELLNYRVDSLNGAEGSSARDRSKMLGFVNKRAEWWWKLREALNPEFGDDLAIPPDPEILADLCSARWELTLRGIKVESKDEIKARLGRSPDKGEALLYSTAEAGGSGQGLLKYLSLMAEGKVKDERTEADIRKQQGLPSNLGIFR